MKTQNTILVPVSKNELEALTMEVKETLASQSVIPNTISSAQLWNIQRKGRRLSYSRNYYN